MKGENLRKGKDNHHSVCV